VSVEVAEPIFLKGGADNWGKLAVRGSDTPYFRSEVPGGGGHSLQSGKVGEGKKFKKGRPGAGRAACDFEGS